MITVFAVLNTTLRIYFPYLNTLKGVIVAIDKLHIYILITIKDIY